MVILARKSPEYQFLVAVYPSRGLVMVLTSSYISSCSEEKRRWSGSC
jgi:hypothetical protein